ncbi:hypothetical protein ACN47E_003463 [Coniothyrium glycines]
MATATLLAQWFPIHKPKGPLLKDVSRFDRNLEESLDIRRSDKAIFNVHKNEPHPESIDFSTLDFLHLSKSGSIRKAFLEELAANPDFELSAGGSRLLNGNNPYTEAAEKQIAEFHNAETALLFHSGFEANVAIMGAIPRPGDAILYDEYIHASTHEGMQISKALYKKSFKHNDVEDFHQKLLDIKQSETIIRDGKRSVLVALESMYSMDGDVSPLEDLIRVGQEVFPDGNCQFLVDEAHTTGVFGTQGRGYVNHLGLEKDVAIRMHTYGKALACTGAAVVCSNTVRETLVNNARSFIYSTAPSFPMVAAIRGGYRLLQSDETQALQDNIQNLVKHFAKTIEANETYEEAVDEGILSIPNIEGWESRNLVTHVVPVMTRQRYTLFLCYHLQMAGINCFPIDYPVVPKGFNRIRIVFHAGNTTQQVEKLASSICEWAQEMLDLEAGGKNGKVPNAARQVHAAQETATGG